MTQSAEYILSSYSFIGEHSDEKILDVGYQSKDGNPIPSFDENLLIELCDDVRHIFEKEPNIHIINGDIIIVGDIHGSFHDLLRIINFLQKNPSKVLFLGDYVDRGNFSLECITILFALKVMYPDSFYLIRGNHEFDSVCKQYGFYEEIINYHNPKKVKEPTSLASNQKLHKAKSLGFIFADESTKNTDSLDILMNEYEEYSSLHKEMDCYKYSPKLYKAFIKAFSYLPIAAIVNSKTFCIHGGLSPRLDNINQINQITRPINEFEENTLFSDLVWSDPTTAAAYFFSENPRGRGCLFTRDAVTNFLNENSLCRMIRAHECVKHGTHCNFHNSCITVFSASSYSKETNNSSGILKLFEKDDSIEFVTFPPIQRLVKSEAVYYKVQAFHANKRLSLHHQQLVSNSTLRLVKSKQINAQISFTPHRASKPFFVSVVDKKDQLIQKPVIHHSVSMNIFSQSKFAEAETKGKIRNLNSFPSLKDS